MKKLVLILLSLVMILSLVSCSQGKNDPKHDDSTTVTTKPDDGKKDPADTTKPDTSADDKPTVTATPEEIEQKIAEAIGKDNYLCDTEIDKDWLQISYSLDMSKVEAYVAKQNSIASVNLDTVIVLKVKDGYADDAAKTLNEIFGNSVGYIRQYPFGTAKVLNGRLYQIGNYVIYVIAGARYEGEDAEAEAKLADSEYKKIDEAIKGVFGQLPKNLAVVPESSAGSGGGFWGDIDDGPVIGG